MACVGANEMKEQPNCVDTGSGKAERAKKNKKKVTTGVSTSGRTTVLRPRSGQLKKMKTGDGGKTLQLQYQSQMVASAQMTSPGCNTKVK